MRILAQTCRPVALARLEEMRSAATIPRDTVAVTFDDGYADNLVQALPVLERYGVPATVFVSTSATLSGHEYWWDRLEQVLLLPGRLPEHLRIRSGDTTVEWDLGDSAGDGAGTLYDPSWRAESRPPTRRHAAYLDLCVRLRSIDAGEREDVLRQLFERAGRAQITRPTHRPLTPDEIATLSCSGVVSIGAHTVTHPALGHRPPAEQEREVRESRELLEGLTGRPVVDFAYPFGGTSTYDGRSVEAVRAAGFRCACTTMPGQVSRFSDPHQLPRVYVHDCDGDAFLRLLANSVHAGGR